MQDITELPTRYEYPNRVEWCIGGKNGTLHREGGPAIEWANGSRFWYRLGQLHREDGPAVEYADGTRVWYRLGQRHREDGPAIERRDGTHEWWVNGVRQPKPTRGRVMQDIVITSFTTTPWGLWAMSADGTVYAVRNADGVFELVPLRFRVAAPEFDD